MLASVVLIFTSKIRTTQAQLRYRPIVLQLDPQYPNFHDEAFSHPHDEVFLPCLAASADVTSAIATVSECLPLNAIMLCPK